jgi:hypothetical protein
MPHALWIRICHKNWALTLGKRRLMLEISRNSNLISTNWIVFQQYLQGTWGTKKKNTPTGNAEV